MPRFRYDQYCPLARAAEVVGERWTLLIVRELSLGGRRFSDLRSALPGLSSSVLTERLAGLEAREIVARRELPPPAPATLYELTETGEALRPVLLDLVRWGLRFLGTRRRGDHFEPEWIRLALTAIARRSSTPRRRYAIRLPSPPREIAIHVSGGRGGTEVSEGTAAGDVEIRADSPFTILGLASGSVDVSAALRAGEIEVTGERAALDDFSAMFEMPSD